MKYICKAFTVVVLIAAQAQSVKLTITEGSEEQTDLAATDLAMTTLLPQWLAASSQVAVEIVNSLKESDKKDSAESGSKEAVSENKNAGDDDFDDDGKNNWEDDDDDNDGILDADDEDDDNDGIKDVDDDDSDNDGIKDVDEIWHKSVNGVSFVILPEPVEGNQIEMTVDINEGKLKLTEKLLNEEVVPVVEEQDSEQNWRRDDEEMGRDQK